VSAADYVIRAFNDSISCFFSTYDRDPLFSVPSKINFFSDAHLGGLSMPPCSLSQSVVSFADLNASYTGDDSGLFTVGLEARSVPFADLAASQVAADSRPQWLCSDCEDREKPRVDDREGEVCEELPRASRMVCMNCTDNPLDVSGHSRDLRGGKSPWILNLRAIRIVAENQGEFFDT
jgi:hypothetical protein